MNKSTTFIFFSVLIVLTGSALFFSLLPRDQASTTNQDGIAEQVDRIAPAPEKSLVGTQPPAGHSANKETIELNATAPFAGKATASRSFDGTWFVLTIQADLPDPPEGIVYNAYLLKTSPKPEFSFINTLAKENGVYSQALYSTGDMSEYREVVITQDTDGKSRPSKATPQVLKGSFEATP